MTCSNCGNCPFDGRAVDSHRHELHITVENSEVEKFRFDCSFLGIKPVLIAMQQVSGGVFEHLMTTSGFVGSPPSAILEIGRLAKALETRGHKVVRRKIETTLDSTIAEQALQGQYYEAHIEIKISRDFVATRNEFERVVEYSNLGLRLSRNAFKIDPNYETHMVTLREKELIRNEFRIKLNQAVDMLSKRFHVTKVISEFAWFDSNIKQDDNWR